jgi:hypothetical protein
MGLHLRRFILVTSLAVLAPLPAMAQSAADKEAARGLMAEGDKAYERKDFHSALQSYSSAHAIMNVTSTGLAVARAEVQLGKLVNAQETARAVTQLPVSGREPTALSRARAEAGRLVDSLEARIPTLTVSVAGAPVDIVDVTVDEKPLPARLLGSPNKFDPGTHKITAIAVGFENSNAEVTLAEGAKETVTLTLVPVAKTEAAHAAPVSTPAAEPADTGKKKSLSPLVYVGFGVGGAGLIVGTVTGILSMSATSSAKEHCTGNLCQPAAQDDIDSAKLFANIANIGFGVAILGTGLGIVGLVTSGGGSEPGPSTTALRIEPLLGPRFVGARGRF